jgi:hypothetical protein
MENWVLIKEKCVIEAKTRLIALTKGRKEKEVASTNRHGLACTKCGRIWTSFHKL